MKVTRSSVKGGGGVVGNFCRETAADAQQVEANRSGALDD